MRKTLLALGLVAGLLVPSSVRAQYANTFPTRTTYVVSVAGQANTAASHAIAIEAGAAKAVRILRVCVTQPGIQTTAGIRILLLERTTAAGTDGVVTAEAAGATGAALARTTLDGTTAFSGVVRAKPTALGTQGATVAIIPIYVPTALAASQPTCRTWASIWDRPPRIPAGVANGIALRDPGAAGGASFAASVEFVEE
jgi:hypothetical protein